MNVKPESGRLCFVERRVALSMPSGVGLCTSEQPDPQCAACTADLPALRFCGTSSSPVKSEITPAELEIYLAKAEINFARCEIGHADVKFYQGCLLAVHSPPYAVRFPP